ncbi:BlaI/MecI/CopY family transcriptional regulator [Paenibacillus polysaccharolyticus]|jgi:predicted transcriptional regulator|uniref:BlaI/MecI/CopY family transcriptional regulator n=3 Tax=Paenibacillus TaxID=44249 RepID=A0A5M9WRV8_PAEAM|nr:MULTISPECIES: BlaI/MecI/CopY family transcriptional regulator [Paenibacillus]KAA8784311.1 BlaI/MecI/CopY family transcriptional regulator [Paenibacillus amylolyticus]MBY0205167.1 BlaI/MecI/CopY family transcriptional regulator [Paenibacillus cucumis (ex Kampfer et al. 2016)]MCM3135475.1 BlaI/MecI/CopY family transcriptional regulator [Paenibacillus polysaccharolyticus]MCP1137283.1 BlaI/MecI/CopY family transcriptional regulator [Paenibacillus polysaccharolyticus]SCZ07200.1 Predicted transcr
MRILNFKVGERGLNRFFGPLEAKIMEVLWARPGSSIREVQTALEQDKDVNFNTVMTVMNRLVDKGLLGKTQKGRTSLYRPVQSREDFMNDQSKELSQELVDEFGTLAVNHMLDALDEADEGLIERLEMKIKQWKKDND